MTDEIVQKALDAYDMARGGRIAQMRAALASVASRVAPLDEAWGRINAIGGTASEHDDFGKGINHAVEQALLIIEELGGRDPLVSSKSAA